MGPDANRAAAADRSPPTAKRGRLSERAWADQGRLTRAEGVKLMMQSSKLVSFGACPPSGSIALPQELMQ